MSAIISHNPAYAVGNTVAGGYVVAAFLNALPATISAVAGLLTIVYMSFQIANAIHDWRERRKKAVRDDAKAD